MKKVLALLSLLITTGVAQAQVKSDIPAAILEETELVIKGNNLDSKNNPTAVSVKTSDGDVIALTPTKSNNKRVVVNMPSVSADTKVVLQVSGGNVSATEPEQFVVLLLNKPEGILTLGDDTTTTSLPADASSDIHASTADEVTLATQSNITSLPNLIEAGTINETLTILGSVVMPGTVVANISGSISGSASSFTGSLSGDVTGTQSSTSIADTVVTGKTVNGFVAAAGTVDASDTILEAFNKLAGNSLQHNGNIADIYSILYSATNGNTANRVVLRDGNGSFAAQDIVAEGKFFGDVNGNVIGNVTGNLTGNVTGDLTGTASDVANSAVIAKTLTGFSAGAGVVADTDSILQALQKLAGNSIANASNIGTNSTNIGTNTTNIGTNTTNIGTNSTDIGNLQTTVNAATNGNTADTLVSRDGNGDFAANNITAEGKFFGDVNGNVIGNVTGNLTGDVTGNVSGTSAGFTGALAGDVTGNQGSTSISATTVTGKALTGFSAGAGTVADTDTILQAFNKVVGNINQHNGNIADLYSSLSSATNGNTANRVVMRDGNGSFAAQDIVAEGKFFGSLNGEEIVANTGFFQNDFVAINGGTFNGNLEVVNGSLIGNVTGDVTGNVSGTSAGFTGALAGDVTGNQGSTSISATTVTGKALTGFVAGAGTVADTDTILQAFNKVVGNISQHNGNISTISGTLDAATNGNSADTLVLRDGNGDFAAESITANGEFLGSLNGTAARAIAGVQAGSATDLEGGVVTASVTGLNLITLTDSNNATTPEDIDTLTGAVAGQVVTIIFAEAVDVTDNETGAADTINVDSNLGLQFSANDSLQLIYNGTSWYEIGRAHNSN